MKTEGVFELTSEKNPIGNDGLINMSYELKAEFFSVDPAVNPGYTRNVFSLILVQRLENWHLCESEWQCILFLKLFFTNLKDCLKYLNFNFPLVSASKLKKNL